MRVFRYLLTLRVEMICCYFNNAFTASLSLENVKCS